MRVLLINPELPPSFWSLSESCKLAGRKTLLPPLGLLTVAALLPQEWEFRLADLNTGPLKTTDWDWADLVLISGMIIQKEGVLNLIRRGKEQGKTTVVGGPYATSLPLEIMQAGADFLVRGEGEITVPYFLAALREGQAGGVIEEDRKPGLTASPVPRFDLLNLWDYLTLGLQTSRGCPFNCEFCDIVSLYGRVPRYKAPGQILRELEALDRLGWRGPVFFSDDNFIGNQQHARAILSQLIPWMRVHGEPFSFWTQASVNLGQDLQLIDLMTAANFSHVFLGVETPETEILIRNRKYQNVKNPLGESLATINANGLTAVASFVLGFDGEQPGTGDRICRFVEETNIPVVMVNLLQPLPNTALWERLQEEGRLLEPTSGDSSGLDLAYVPTRPRQEILAEYAGVIDRLYEPSRYLSRAYRYFLKMRPTRRAQGLQTGEKLASPRPAKVRRSYRVLLDDARILLAMLWKHGLCRPYRGQFWRQLLGIYRHNPSRLKTYIISCEIGENLAAFRKKFLQKYVDQGLR